MSKLLRGITIALTAGIVALAPQAALAKTAALTGKSPIGNPYLAGVDVLTAKFLQEVARETVQDYYGKSSLAVAEPR